MTQRCAQLDNQEKVWILDRLHGVMKKNQCSTVQAIRRVFSVRTVRMHMAAAIRKDQVARVRAAAVVDWLQQCSSAMADMETNMDDSAAVAYCRAKHRTLLRATRGLIGSAIYPEGEKAR
eukprot:5925851-Prymnesium_polylepis.1